MPSFKCLKMLACRILSPSLLVFPATLSLPALAFDSNGDGRAEIIWRHYQTGTNAIYQLDQGMRVQSIVSLNTVDTSWHLAGEGDFNGDGKTDLFWRHASGANHLYLFNDLTIQQSLSFSNVPKPWVLGAIGDFNGDGSDDVYWRNSETGQNHIHFMQAGKMEQSYAVAGVPIEWELVGAGDWDGDSDDDLLWRHGISGELYFHLMEQGKVILTRFLAKVADKDWEVAAIGDINGDGREDIVWRHALTGANHAYLLDNAALMQSAPINRVVDSAWLIVASGDYNKDGLADLLWRHQSTGINYIYSMQGTAILSDSRRVNTVAERGWQALGHKHYRSSRMQRLAEQLDPGEYQLLDTGLLHEQATEGNISVLTWSDSAGWDPVHRRVQMVCKRASTFPHRHMIYNERANQWQVNIESEVFGTTGHCYDGNATDPQNGVHYFLPYYSTEVRRYAQGQWDRLSAMPVSRVAAMSATWIEQSSKGPGLLTVVGGSSGAGWYNPLTESWERLKDTTNYPVDGVTWGTYHVVSEYNPVHRLTVMGGGNEANNVLYKMDEDFQFSLLQATPFAMGARSSLLSVDPVSGNYLVYDFNGKSWWHFDPINDSWSVLDEAVSPPLFDSNIGAVQVPIPEYGVVMFIEASSEPKVYLYKNP